MKLSSWDYLIIGAIILAILLLINHLFTGKSWEIIVGAIITSQVALWKEFAEIKSDIKEIKFRVRKLNNK